MAVQAMPNIWIYTSVLLSLTVSRFDTILVVGMETLDSHTQCNDALSLSNTLDGRLWRDIASCVAMKG